MSSISVAGATSGSIRLSAPAVSGSSVLTLPVATDTLVGRATTDTLTNKTLTSPILTSPALGTPASGVLTNCTGLPILTGVTGTLPVANGGTGTTSTTFTNLTTNVTGTLPVANGGTGVTTSTGTGAVVLSASPTFTGTPLSTTAASATNTTQIATTAFAYGTLSNAQAGYMKLSNGMLMQWFQSGNITDFGGLTSTTVSYPLAFPTAIHQVFISYKTVSGNGPDAMTAWWNPTAASPLSVCTISYREVGGVTQGTFNLIGWAIGY